MNVFVFPLRNARVKVASFRILLTVFLSFASGNTLYAADWSIASQNYSGMTVECTISRTSGALGDMGYYSDFTSSFVLAGAPDVSLAMNCKSFDEPWVKSFNCTESSFKSSKTWTLEHDKIAGFAFMIFPSKSQVCEVLYNYARITLKKN
jgi:hypothetical protein